MSVHDLADEASAPREGERVAEPRAPLPRLTELAHAAPLSGDAASNDPLGNALCNAVESEQRQPLSAALAAEILAAEIESLDAVEARPAVRSFATTDERALAAPRAEPTVALPASAPLIQAAPPIHTEPLTPALAPAAKTAPRSAFLRGVRASWAWLDTWQREADAARSGPNRIDWARAMPFWTLHLSVLALPFVGFNWFALASAIALYVIRMFAITGFYHRYFSHRTFRTTRPAQFVFAFLGNCSLQRGPLWWAAHHRDHHRDSDGPTDAHSPVRDGFLWSHFGWWTAKHNVPTRVENIRDFARYRELRFLDRFDIFAPLMLGALMWGLGYALSIWAPGLGTNGTQLLVYSLVSTIVLFHATFTINSLAHVWGTRRFETGDQSRNNWFLALLTLGEGWHNNHHHHSHSVRQGIYWWEIDLTFYGIKVLEWMGIVWDLRPVPQRVYSESIRARRRGE